MEPDNSERNHNESDPSSFNLKNHSLSEDGSSSSQSTEGDIFEQSKIILSSNGFWDAVGEKAHYVSVFGSVAYKGHSTNDIDIFCLLREPLTEGELKQATDCYFDLHAKLDLIPDVKFPGEYVQMQVARAAFLGKGFPIEENKVSIPEIATGGDWTDFNDYRHHLTAMGGPSKLLFGSDVAYQIMKRRALLTLIHIRALEANQMSFTVDSLRESLIGTGKSYLGFADHSGVRSYLDDQLKEVLEYGIKKGLWSVDENRKFIYVDQHPLERLKRQITRYNSEK